MSSASSPTYSTSSSVLEFEIEEAEEEKIISLNDAIEIIESGGIEYCKPEPKTKTNSSKIKNFFLLPFPFFRFHIVI